MESWGRKGGWCGEVCWRGEMQQRHVLRASVSMWIQRQTESEVKKCKAIREMEKTQPKREANKCKIRKDPRSVTGWQKNHRVRMLKSCLRKEQRWSGEDQRAADLLICWRKRTSETDEVIRGRGADIERSWPQLNPCSQWTPVASPEWLRQQDQVLEVLKTVT